MDSVWEDDPDSYKLEFVFRDSKNVASWWGVPETSHLLHSLCGGCWFGPRASVNRFCFVFGNSVFPLRHQRDVKAGKPVRFAGRIHVVPGISRDGFNRGQCSSLHITTRTPKLSTDQEDFPFPILGIKASMQCFSKSMCLSLKG